MSLKLRKLGDAAAAGSAGEGRNKPNRLLQLSVVVVVAIVVYVGGIVLNYAPSRATAEPTVESSPITEVFTQTVSFEPTATPTMLPDVFKVTDEPTQAPVVHEVIVTATPTPTPVEPQYIYVQVTQEVIVEVTPTPMPTATPTPALPAGTIKVCAEVEGATALYINGLGVVSGGCQQFTFGVGQTAIVVHVNK